MVKKQTENLKLDDLKSEIYLFGPGEKYIVLQFIPNVLLKSTIGNVILGIPQINISIDNFSFLPTGISIGMGSQLNSMKSLLYNTVESKIDFCKRYGIEITQEKWPDTPLPSYIMVDRGHNNDSDLINVVSNLRINVINIRSLSLNFRRGGERIVNHIIKALSPKGLFDRVDSQKRSPVLLTIDELNKIVIEAIIYHNKTSMVNYSMSPGMINDGVVSTPLDIWHWGVKNLSGGFRHIKPMPDKYIALNLLSGGYANITEEGLRFKGLLYDCSIDEIRTLFPESGVKSGSKVTVYYDTRNCNNIFVSDETGNVIRQYHLNKKFEDYNNKAYIEIEAYQDYMRKMRCSEEYYHLSGDVKGIQNTYETPAKNLRKHKEIKMEEWNKSSKLQLKSDDNK